MQDSHNTPLFRLLKPREIESLLGEFEILLPGYCLSLCGIEGQTLAGDPVYEPQTLNKLLTTATDSGLIEYEEDLIQPLLFESQIKGAVIAHPIKQNAATASNLVVRRVCFCIIRTLSLLLAKAIETRDVVNETVERYREINLLYQIGETIGTCLDPRKIPQLVLLEANRCIQAEAGFVLLASDKFNESTDRCSNYEIKASAGNKEYLQVLQQVSKQVIDEVIETKQPVITTFPWATKHAVGDKELFAAILSVPFQVGERTQGMIVLGRMADQNIFTAGEMKLLLAVASQASIALETVRLHLEEIKKQRLEGELAISRQIQLSLLPDTSPTAVGWDFAALYQAARQVGGDLYDFLQLPNQPNTMGLLIADVAGKGIPAALFMAFCRTILRVEAMTGDPPAQVLKRTNQLILQNNRSGLFLTAFYALLNQQNGVLVYANGGHNPPLWFRSENGECQELTSQGHLIGLFRDVNPEERQIEVRPGDILVFYTDGITEARDKDGNFFGEERLVSSIMENKEAGAGDILDKILTATNEFIGSLQQSDDFTLFVIKRKVEGR